MGERGWRVAALTPAVLATVLVELALWGVLGVPIPFLLLLAAVVTSAGLGGLAVGGLAGVMASGVVLHATWAGWGPETLTGGALQASTGCALMMVAGIVVGRVRTQRDSLLQQLRDRQVALEAEVAARTAELEETHARVLAGARMQALGTAAGNVAHEFNNLLTPILANAALLSDSEGPLAGRAEDLDLARSVERAAERAALLVTQMLDFARRRSQRVPVRVTPREVVDGALELLGASLGAGVTIERRDDDATAPVVIDAVAMQQALMNLCVNARDAMDGEGRLELHSARLRVDSEVCASCREVVRGEWVTLSIGDDGPGIPDEARGRLFEPFYTTKPVGRGTGMGLALVHGAVHADGGHVLLETSSRGTTFTLLIPPDEATIDVAPPPPSSPTGGGAVAGLTIWIVDDEPEVRAALARLLRRDDAKCVTFEDAEACLTELSRAEVAPKLVITDLTMPRMNGMQLADRLRDLAPRTRVLLCTGHADEATRQAAAVRDLALLEKPLTPEALRAAVREAASLPE